MLATSAHAGPVVNLCIGYTGREDLLQAAAACRAAVASGQLRPSDVSEPLLRAALYTAGDPPVALLVRTSGERRAARKP